MNRDKVLCVMAGLGIVFSTAACLMQVGLGAYGWVVFNLVFLVLNTRNFLFFYRRLSK